MSQANNGNRLVAAELAAALGECQIGKELHVVEETSSTNDLAWQAETRGAPEGFVVFAERQTAGRGRYGRRWESAPSQGLWFSVLLHPPLTLKESPHLTSLLAKTIATTITDQFGCIVWIKMPNDIYFGSRKIAGILVEGRNGNNGNYVAVAGLGVNLNQAISDFPDELRETAGSLRIATGRHVERAQFAAALLRKLEENYRDAYAGVVGRNR